MNLHHNAKKTAWLYLGLVFAQALHSLEEVFTGLWRYLEVVTGGMHARNFAIPVLRANGQVFLMLNAMIVLAMAGLLPFVFQARPWALKAAQWIAVIEVINGTSHLGAAVAVRGYFPGMLAGIGLLIIGIGYVRHNLIRREYDGYDPFRLA